MVERRHFTSLLWKERLVKILLLNKVSKTVFLIGFLEFWQNKDVQMVKFRNQVQVPDIENCRIGIRNCEFQSFATLKVRFFQTVDTSKFGDRARNIFWCLFGVRGRCFVLVGLQVVLWCLNL